ncbi:zinc-dependent alcohol dehydrogenase [Microbacterium invictum]|uniref:Alcohol dehydrogenase catalytic domain-containing protein n=1 Tax=Microbacterium invictum TaxID=515415 RepID=A0ABZ0VAT4_9MICO|nr:alcohol dehydrogenase catalytic domain-containing protein [Microbacterium invictum]WQB69917.1 alcohol dehydrogenase catalytic domain-containing protein [Microbacterium invictum]
MTGSSSTSMKVAVYYGRGDVRVEERARPRLGEGQALLRVLRSGICGTDATEWKSGPLIFPVDRAHPVSGHRGPLILGHEFVGEIVELSPEGSEGFHVGDHVASGAGVSCGRCDRCREGRTNLCEEYVTYGLNVDGGLAEYVAVDTSTLVPIPAGCSLDVAGVAQPLAVGLHAARRAGVRDGDRVILYGAGAIGTFILAGLASLVDADITVVDFAGPRLDRALRVGAARVVPVGDGTTEVLREAVGPRGADVVIEATGAPGQLTHALGLVRPGGTILCVGLPSTPQELDMHRLVLNEVTLATTVAHVCGEDLAPALEILAETELGDALVEAVYPLSEVPAQLARLARGEIHGKVLFDPTRRAVDQER